MSEDPQLADAMQSIRSVGEDEPNARGAGEEIAFDGNESRYELTVDGEVIGFIDTSDDGGTRAFLHTQVDDAHRGQGVGTRLIARALEDVKRLGMTVDPRCPMVADYLGKHPDAA